MSKVDNIIELIKVEEKDFTSQDVCKIIDSLPRKKVIDVIKALMTQHPDIFFGEELKREGFLIIN
jgi:hypothetical protein